MVETPLFFEQRKWIRKCYWKKYNVNEVQRRRNEFGTQPATHVAIARLCYNFEAHRTVQNVNKRRSGIPLSLTDDVLNHCYWL
jgi:hypothetical protein